MIKIALGPVLYYWQREVMFNFYDAMATTAVDIVYLGETVCARRHELRLADWLDIARRLRLAGKEVVLSTQVLLESGAEVASMHKIADNADFLVEANDMGAVQRLVNAGQPQGDDDGLRGGNTSRAKTPFVAGPHLNIYNLPSLQWMAALGARRWVMPLEMKRSDLAILQQGRPAGLQTEVFAYGRMPLAFSARCFTARQRNLPKDDCRFSCMDYPDGLMLKTREHEDFLILNGTQTQSAKVYNLVESMDEMQSMGVDVVRISPQSQYMERIISVFDAVRTGQLAMADGTARLQPLMPYQPCNGYWNGQPGLDQVNGSALVAQA